MVEEKNLSNVDRDNVLEGLFNGFRRKQFNPWKHLNVKLVGEDGIDTGGLMREVMSLAMAAISKLPIFAGPDSRKAITLHAPCK